MEFSKMTEMVTSELIINAVTPLFFISWSMIAYEIITLLRFQCQDLKYIIYHYPNSEELSKCIMQHLFTEWSNQIAHFL